MPEPDVAQALDLVRRRLARLEVERDEARADAIAAREALEKIEAQTRRGKRGVEPLESVATVAERLGVQKSWLYAMTAARNGIPFYKVGKYIRFRQSELTAWIEAQRGNGPG